VSSGVGFFGAIGEWRSENDKDKCYGESENNVRLWEWNLKWFFLYDKLRNSSSV
jgi:hypothetical protein